ncbi:MAG TPA: enoyl-CoA hydratase-related protein [Candidatus Eisenbacteria bacterium]|nr:enoyl-CoA hydratase-related protein [Candidatus Eisenbacteria bacterium]
MPSVHVTVERGLARVELDRPPLNVIDLGSATELALAIEGVAARDEVAVIAVTGRGRAFCAGVDVRDHLPDRGADMLRAFHHACLALLESPQPTVAIVQGAALGGGCELTLACDLVLASERASFGQPEIKLGVFPPLAAVALPRVIASHLASELLFTGRIVGAAEAARIGLVNRVVEESGLAAAAEETLGELLALSPASLRLTKELMRRSRGWTAEDIRAAERFYVERLMRTPDAVEGLEAFLQKRAPRWSGTAPERAGLS